MIIEFIEWNEKTISIRGGRKTNLLADLPAYRFVYTGKEGQYNFKAQELWAIKADKVYNISYIAPLNQYTNDATNN